MRDMIEEMVDELLDIDGDINIANNIFSRSDILRSLDPIAYREMCIDFADAHIADLQDELDCLDPVTDFDEVQDLKDRIKELENI
jgi:prephenate dehydrogenase